MRHSAAYDWRRIHSATPQRNALTRRDGCAFLSGEGSSCDDRRRECSGPRRRPLVVRRTLAVIATFHRTAISVNVGTRVTSALTSQYSRESSATLRRIGRLTNRQTRVNSTTTGPPISSHGSTPSFSVGSPCVQPAAASGQFTAKYHNSHIGTTAGIPNSKFTPTTVSNHVRIRPVFTPRDRLHLLPESRVWFSSTLNRPISSLRTAGLLHRSRCNGPTDRAWVSVRLVVGLGLEIPSRYEL